MFQKTPLNTTSYFIFSFNTSCGRYKITATAVNSISTISKSISVNVACPIEGLNIKTVPIANTNGIIMVSKDFNFELHVSLSKGSYPIYEINFEGENQNTVKTVNHSGVLSPLNLQEYYTYELLKNYDVTVKVKSLLDPGLILKTVLHLEVVKCAAPPMNFPYGSAERPVVISRGVDSIFTAFYTYNKSICGNIDDKLIMKWKFIELNKTNKINADEQESNVTRNGYTLSYFIRRYKFEKGLYELQLHLSFNSSSYIYTGYINISEIGLQAQIKNGIFQAIPIHKINNKGDYTYYITELSGTDSYDPEARKDGIKKMTFVWKCRVKSNKTTVDRARQNSTRIVTFQCLNQSFRVIGNDSILPINTTLFLRKVKYEFQLLVKKDNKSGIFQQEVEFIEGNPPNVNIS